LISRLAYFSMALVVSYFFRLVYFSKIKNNKNK